MSDFWQAFTQPAVRDLAWLIGTPPLLTPLDDTAGFSDVYWPDNTFFSELLAETMPLLQKLDREPAALIEHSENSRDYRLGCYLCASRRQLTNTRRWHYAGRARLSRAQQTRWHIGALGTRG